MRTLLLSLPLAMVATLAAADDKASAPSRSAECAAQAVDRKLSGDARKQFVADCMKAQPPAPADRHVSPQAEKMKICSKEASAKALKGDERRSFMSTCLRADRKP